MQEFLGTADCLMAFVGRELDDPAAAPCGRCANCSGDILPRDIDHDLVDAAERFLGRSWAVIPPRKFLPAGVLPDRPKRKLDPETLVEPSLALCSYADSGWGKLVQAGKYETGHFDDRLLAAGREAIVSTWPIDPRDWWLTSVPSLRHPGLVSDFAQRLAATLSLPYVPALTKTRETLEQKLMQNSAQQVENVMTAFRAEKHEVRPGPVIVVDDMIDSGWTMTVCGARLRRAGSGPVYPFALATFRRIG